MSLKSFFNNAGAAIQRFWEDQEIASLERQRLMAKNGLTVIAGRSGAYMFPLKPEDAAKAIAQCDARLAEIQAKRSLSLK